MFAQTGKVLDKIHQFVGIDPKAPGQKPSVLGATQLAMERACKANRPGNRAVVMNMPAVGDHGAGNNP